MFAADIQAKINIATLTLIKDALNSQKMMLILILKLLWPCTSMKIESNVLM